MGDTIQLGNLVHRRKRFLRSQSWSSQEVYQDAFKLILKSVKEYFLYSTFS